MSPSNNPNPLFDDLSSISNNGNHSQQGFAEHYAKSIHSPIHSLDLESNGSPLPSASAPPENDEPELEGFSLFCFVIFYLLIFYPAQQFIIIWIELRKKRLISVVSLVGTLALIMVLTSLLTPIGSGLLNILKALEPNFMKEDSFVEILALILIASTLIVVPLTITAVLWDQDESREEEAKRPQVKKEQDQLLLAAKNFQLNLDQVKAEAALSEALSLGVLEGDDRVTEIRNLMAKHRSRYLSEFTNNTPFGKGGFGTVFKCTSKDGQIYAIKKVLLIEGAINDPWREVQILAKLTLNHPHDNILKYYSAWKEVATETDILEAEKSGTTNQSSTSRDESTDNYASHGEYLGMGKYSINLDEVANPLFSNTAPSRQILYIQTQYCSKKTLREFIAARYTGKKPFDMVEALGLFVQVADGVEHLHSQGLLHRDLKPSNCFIDSEGVVKIGDFGLSRALSSSWTTDGAAKSQSHSTGGDSNTAHVGTMMYASPEQIRGSDYGKSTDVYSLGIMLFEMLYLMKSRGGKDVFSDLRSGEFPEDWLNGVAVEQRELHELLVKMISHSPSQRPTVKEVAEVTESVDLTTPSTGRRSGWGRLELGYKAE